MKPIKKGIVPKGILNVTSSGAFVLDAQINQPPNPKYDSQSFATLIFSADVPTGTAIPIEFRGISTFGIPGIHSRVATFSNDPIPEGVKTTYPNWYAVDVCGDCDLDIMGGTVLTALINGTTTTTFNVAPY